VKGYIKGKTVILNDTLPENLTEGEEVEHKASVWAGIAGYYLIYDVMSRQTPCRASSKKSNPKIYHLTINIGKLDSLTLDKKY
jgi:hypothetical protein